MKEIDEIYQGLQIDNQKGCFTLEQSSNLLTSLKVLADKIQKLENKEIEAE